MNEQPGTTQPSTTRPAGLEQRLAHAAEVVEQVAADTPAVVQLTQAWNGFYVARTVTVLLDAEAVPHRDAYALAEGWCTQALYALRAVVGERLVRRYSPDHVAGELLLQELTIAGQFELYASSDMDVDRIAAAMIRLTARLGDLLTRVAADDAALPDLRAAARAVAPAARNIWSHYGGDSGGW